MARMERRARVRRNDAGPEGRDEVVEAVLAAARARFADRGPSRVTIREIAEAANVNHALVHRHFHTKHELLRQVMATFIPESGERITPGMTWDEAVGYLFQPDPRHATWARMLAWLILESDVDVALVERFPIVETMVDLAGAGQPDSEEARLAVAAVELMALGWHLLGSYVVEMAGLGHLDESVVVERLGSLASRMGDGREH